MKGCSCLLALAAVAAIGAAAPEPGFTSLFNGKDLTGWRYKRTKGTGLDSRVIASRIEPRPRCLPLFREFP
jgi:hypothetical protein